VCLDRSEKVIQVGETTSLLENAMPSWRWNRSVHTYHSPMCLADAPSQACVSAQERQGRHPFQEQSA
jgi:hypothetical protein